MLAYSMDFMNLSINRVLISTNIMNLVLGLIGLFVHYIFLQKRELLYQRRSALLILLVATTLFILTFLLVGANIGNPKTIKLLTIPLSTLTIFYSMKFVFFKLYHRNPEDTFWSMDIRQMRDGLFNFIFWVLGLVVPAIFAFKVLP